MQSLGMTFRNMIEPFSKTAAYRCPCCCCLTLHERGGYESCPVCFWEDDGQDDHDAEEVRGAALMVHCRLLGRDTTSSSAAFQIRHTVRTFDLLQK